MPVLHTYRSKEGHYILAGVKGRIVTYRLSNINGIVSQPHTKYKLGISG